MPDHHQREAAFHDAWADQDGDGDAPLEALFEGPTAQEGRFLRALLPDWRGRRVLDVGCGLGESAVYFARLGAAVTATDLSPGMIAATRHLAERHGANLQTFVIPAERLPFPDGSYDVLHAANLLHHLRPGDDRRRFLAEARRVLRPGGLFLSWDPVRYNPAINLYRRMASAVRTPDEEPLGRADARLIREFFPDARLRFFWIASLALFAKYYLVDRVHPNQDRYWKRIYREDPRRLGWWRPLAALDQAVLTRLPGLRWLAWNVVAWGHPAPAPAKVPTSPGAPVEAC